LKGAPKKKGFKLAHVQPPPVNMQLGVPWEAPAAGSAAAGSLPSSAAAADRAKWVCDRDFDALCNKVRSAVAKPGFNDAATAALHNKEVL
jgi:hypothetical protein